MKTIFLTLLLSLGFILVLGQEKLLTVAEQSDFTSTSRYDNVMSFIKELENQSSNLYVETIATTNEGREVPLMIIGDPLPMSPSDLENDHRVVVYIQANIHAGEVEGKEASLMFARDLLINENKDILNDIVVLICPILNADGNERISTRNRTNQNGPVNGVGIRSNSLFLDLNRDAMKVETKEMQGVIQNIFVRWDPHVTMDCHTTNGSYHEEPVTFTWIMNPNGDRSLINYMRDKMMPQVSHRLRNHYKVENCFYGEFIDRGDIDRGWISYASSPRYMSNYIGIRNRLGILNENYVYADYKTRVYGCYNLIWSLFDYAKENHSEINHLTDSVDKVMMSEDIRTVRDSFAIEYEGRPTPEKITIKAFESELDTVINGWRIYKKTDRRRTVTIPYIADYYATSNVAFPYAYVIDVNDQEIIDLIRVHGIKVHQVKESVKIEVDRFVIENIEPSARLNQGHYTTSIQGHFVKEEKLLDKDTYVIPTNQPLGNLVAYLLEPQSDDGLTVWNYFDRYLAPQWGRRYYPHPVYKIVDKKEFSKIETKTVE